MTSTSILKIALGISAATTGLVLTTNHLKADPPPPATETQSLRLRIDQLESRLKSLESQVQAMKSQRMGNGFNFVTPGTPPLAGFMFGDGSKIKVERIDGGKVKITIGDKSYVMPDDKEKLAKDFPEFKELEPDTMAAPPMPNMPEMPANIGNISVNVTKDGDKMIVKITKDGKESTYELPRDKDKLAKDFPDLRIGDPGSMSFHFGKAEMDHLRGLAPRIHEELRKMMDEFHHESSAPVAPPAPTAKV